MMQFDPQILDLLPHRPPMLLINRLTSVTASRAQALVDINESTPFLVNGVVPAWFGLEYMGQTAALIAGFQEREGLCDPHLGFLLGSRSYNSTAEVFDLGQTLSVTAEEAAVVGGSLATFNCTISDHSTEAVIASASLSVFRKPLS